jgi:hypothetical protein
MYFILPHVKIERELSISVLKNTATRHKSCRWSHFLHFRSNVGVFNRSWKSIDILLTWNTVSFFSFFYPTYRYTYRVSLCYSHIIVYLLFLKHVFTEYTSPLQLCHQSPFIHCWCFYLYHRLTKAIRHLSWQVLRSIQYQIWGKIRTLYRWHGLSGTT